MISNVFVIEGAVKTWEEAIDLTFNKLYEEKCVKETFLKGCIERENKFPTGLPTEIPVSIPHTFAEHVLVPAICVLKPENPVRFTSMEDTQQIIDAEFVFNMALNDDKDQLNMIRAIIEVARDSHFLKKAKVLSVDVLRDLLYEKWVINGS